MIPYGKRKLAVCVQDTIILHVHVTYLYLSSKAVASQYRTTEGLCICLLRCLLATLNIATATRTLILDALTRNKESLL